MNISFIYLILIFLVTFYLLHFYSYIIIDINFIIGLFLLTIIVLILIFFLYFLYFALLSKLNKFIIIFLLVIIIIQITNYIFFKLNLELFIQYLLIYPESYIKLNQFTFLDIFYYLYYWILIIIKKIIFFYNHKILNIHILPILFLIFPFYFCFSLYRIKNYPFDDLKYKKLYKICVNFLFGLVFILFMDFTGVLLKFQEIFSLIILLVIPISFSILFLVTYIFWKPLPLPVIYILGIFYFIFLLILFIIH